MALKPIELESVDREICIGKTSLNQTMAEWAYIWSRDFPEYREEMRQFIKEAKWAYHWSCTFPEDKEYMRRFINEERWAYYWSCKFPEDKEFMRQFINNAEF